jgi:hypothetical protein
MCATGSKHGETYRPHYRGGLCKELTAWLPEKHRRAESGFDEDSMKQVLEYLERLVTHPVAASHMRAQRSAEVSFGGSREFRSNSFQERQEAPSARRPRGRFFIVTLLKSITYR